MFTFVLGFFVGWAFCSIFAVAKMADLQLEIRSLQQEIFRKEFDSHDGL